MTKFSTLQENMKAGLDIVGRGVGKGTFPVLTHILFRAKGDKVSLTSNSLEMSIQTIVGAKVEGEGEGAFTLPYRIMADLMAKLPAERVDVEWRFEDYTASLKCAGSRTTIKGLDADEFPMWPALAGVEANIDSYSLQQIAKTVALCAAKDMSRPVFTGVLLTLSESAMLADGADGFRLGRLHTNGLHVAKSEFGKLPAEMVAEVDGELAVSTIIPANVVMEVARIAAIDEDEPVTVTIAERGVRFTVGPTVIFANTINGQYPDVSRVIPTNNPITVQTDHASLNTAIKVASLFARDSANILRLTLAPGDDGEYDKLLVAGQSAEFGDAVTPVAALVDGLNAGATFEIGLNSAFVADALKAIQSPQVIIKMSQPASPVIFTGAGAGNYMNVVMPMHIQGR